MKYIILSIISYFLYDLIRKEFFEQKTINNFPPNNKPNTQPNNHSTKESPAFKTKSKGDPDEYAEYEEIK